MLGPEVPPSHALPPPALAILRQLPRTDACTILASIGNRGALRAFDRDCRQREAARLLRDERVPRAEVRQRLQAQGMSRRTAQRVIEHVLRRPS